MAYYEIKLEIPENHFDILTAELNELSYEGFIEHEDHILAYIPESLFERDSLLMLQKKYKFIRGFQINKIDQQNWNEEWEKQYEPVIFLNKYLFRAPFHNENKDFVNFIISPKMAFGTGHHETTELMINLMDNLPIDNKTVLDYGSGTGILSIFASYKNADKITALDIEQEAFDSCLENCTLNNIENVEPISGDINSIKEQVYDIILANLNRNIIVNSARKIDKILKPGGFIFTSGFFEEDISTISDALNSYTLLEYQVKNNWAVCLYIKK